MSNKSKPSAVFFRGDNRDGLPVVVTITVGGNAGTGPCVGISIFDAFIFDHIRETCSDTMEARHKYLEYNKTPDGLEAACGGCIFGKPKRAKKHGLGGCYAQLNFTTVMEAAGIIMNAKDNVSGFRCDGLSGLRLDILADMLAGARGVGMRDFRSAIVGDTGILSEEVGTAIMDLVKSMGFSTLGYTHQWHRSPWLRDTHQASTQSAKGNSYGMAHKAQSDGWGVFHVAAISVDTVDPKLTLCFKQDEKQKGNAANCQGCPEKCDGSGFQKVVFDHANGARLKKSRGLPMYQAA